MNGLNTRNMNIRILRCFHRMRVNTEFVQQSRDADGLVYYLNGSQKFEFFDGSSEPFEGCEGDIIYLPFQSRYRNTVHIPKTEYYQIDFILYKDDAPTALFNSPRVFTGLDQLKYKELFIQINTDYVALDESQCFACFGKLCELINLLSSQRDPAHRVVLDRIKNSVCYINEFYFKNTTIEEIAALSSTCVSNLERLFKVCFGVTPSVYRNMVRIMHAKQLLLSGLTIDEVASAVGFYDPFHFSKTFKRIVGVSPGEYARAGMNK